jgi:hypothetical protein
MVYFGTGRMLPGQPKNIVLNLGITLTVLLLFFMASCDLEMLKPTLKVPITTKIDFHIDSLRFKSELVLIHEETINMDIDSLIRHYEGNPDLIKNALVKSVTLKVLHPEGSELSFLESSSVSVLAPAFEEVVIATATHNTSVAGEITYILTEAAGNVLQLISSEDDLIIRIYGLVAGPVPVNIIDLLMEIQWEVAVDPF